MRETICVVVISLAATIASAQDAGQTVASEGDWVLKKAVRPSGDGVECILAPKSLSRIQIVGNRFEVTGLPRHSIFNFRYRIDDKPVSNLMFPTTQMQEAGTISLDGDVLESILNGQRFSIRLLDKWHEAITEDVSLAGLRSLRDKSVNACR